MSQETCIALNNQSFDKFSKKLYHNIKNETDLSLSKTKEIISQSLGFRNYHGVKDFFNENITKNSTLSYSNSSSQVFNNNSEKNYLQPNHHFLNRFSNENIISLASILIMSDNTWSERALILLKTILSLIDTLKIEKTSDNLRHYAVFDRLFHFYKTTDNVEAKKLLLVYFENMLPGFSENGENHTAADQNSYLSVQLMPFIEFLNEVEKNDFIMFSLAWLVDLNDKTPLTLKMLQNYKNIKKGGLGSAKTWGDFFNGHGEISLAHLEFNNRLTTSEAYHDSWLCDEAFVSIITSKIITLKHDTFYFSDFLLNVSKVVNAEKRKTYLELLQNMKHNYGSCIDYSAELYHAVHLDNNGEENT